MTYWYVGAVLVYVPAPRGGRDDKHTAPAERLRFVFAVRDCLTGACVSPDPAGILVFPAVSDAIVVFSGVTQLPFSAPSLAAIRLFLRPVFVWKHNGLAILETEHHAPVAGDAHAPLASTVPLQGMQPEAWRVGTCRVRRLLQPEQDASEPRHESNGDSPGIVALVKCPQSLVPDPHVLL